MEVLSKETINSFQSDKDVVELQEQIKQAQKAHDETKGKRTHEEQRLKKVREDYKQIQKQFYVFTLTSELQILQGNIRKEEELYESCQAKRKRIENESERLSKSKYNWCYCAFWFKLVQLNA